MTDHFHKKYVIHSIARALLQRDWAQKYECLSGHSAEVAELIRTWPKIRLEELAAQQKQDLEHKDAKNVGLEWLAGWHEKERIFVTLAHDYFSDYDIHRIIYGKKYSLLLENAQETLQEATDIRFIITRAFAVEPREHLPPYLQREQPPIVRDGLQQLHDMREQREQKRLSRLHQPQHSGYDRGR